MELYNFNIINCNLDLKQSTSFIINFYRWTANKNYCEPVVFDFANDFTKVFPNNLINSSAQMIESYKQHKTIPNPLPIDTITLPDDTPFLFRSVELNDDLYGIESRDFVNLLCNESLSARYPKPQRLVYINHSENIILNSWELKLLTDPQYKNIFLFDTDSNTNGIKNILDRFGLNKDNQKNKFLEFENYRWYDKLDTNGLSNYLLFPKFVFRNNSDDCTYSLLNFNKGGKLIEIVEIIFNLLLF